MNLWLIIAVTHIIKLLTQSSENTDGLRNGPRRDSFSISFPSAFDNGDGIHRSVKVTIYVEIQQALHICEWEDI